MRTLALGAVAVLLLAACGDTSSSDGDDVAPADSVTVSEMESPVEEQERLESGDDLEYPPDVIVRGGGETLELTPYVFCWSSGCVDGAPPDPLPDLGEQSDVTVEFPAEDWEFSASFRRAGDACARTQSIELERTSATTFRLRAAGVAGTYDVDLFGRGDGGDVAVQFRWTTTVAGELPEPEALIAVLADNDGTVDSYGVELSVVNLGDTPDRAEATVTVTAADGASLSFEPTPVGTEDEGCEAVEGLLVWNGPEDKGLEAAALGEPPFMYTVELELDGVRHEATATWPDEEIPGNEPSVPLTFDPALPALSADV
ncbi:hypothetical protein [Phytoactinopolyspora endophytica]|uniref:hypothetical protein n=1 Tax=Phytoactinopolyspora endophytica TaxID=1642495 RepID=UPI00101DDFB1|nr:hypothetical protein [Phytoactinopolyspora endophytica]